MFSCLAEWPSIERAGPGPSVIDARMLGQVLPQKGGSGKSTLAVGIAVAAMGNGERVAIVEADPQGTTSKWIERRGHPYPRVVRVADPAEIEGPLVSPSDPAQALEVRVIKDDDIDAVSGGRTFGFLPNSSGGRRGSKVICAEAIGFAPPRRLRRAVVSRMHGNAEVARKFLDDMRGPSKSERRG
jgi:hypothetical protein